MKITIVGGSCIKKEIVGLYLEVIFVRDNIYIYIYIYIYICLFKKRIKYVDVNFFSNKSVEHQHCNE